ncbi:IS4 family transposase [Zhongshania aliphaticivorans]|uniref:Transposase n=1 Tax=Zhongshania aliphaticivorans TaxID=1470434 RepID=A0A127M9L6_9GAMM|nr:IS4 family transposase [Zhongshania aliphaticivorans]AMO67252.1 transposase [Zhongshania aliphaticivorans]AMO69193.1 transposase [Zhongshania aliphaticivorans]AMO69330.1 transposase [Zhongshania aliphaticivorans]AMO69943.1 transposase [Zhongshania aliphaticivorans]AMO70142.1 transposase [Zhongshania aliphaticivorans]
MAHHNTVFSQLLKLVSRHEFENLAKQHHEGQKLRKMSRWSQFVALSLAQFSGRSSLRDIVSNLSAQAARLYHLGTGNVSRSTLSRVNESQPYTLYEALFHKLLSRCQGVAPKHGFRFGNKLYSLDSTTIDLCLSVFPWAKFRRAKGAVKVHIGLDHDGLLPSFVSISDGKKHDVTVGRVLEFPADSIVVMDRAYTDYTWFKALNDKGIFFVTRQKRNATYRIIERREVIKSKGLTCDQTILITGAKAKTCPIPLRRIGFRDAETGKHYVFLTNNFHLAAKTIADIYKSRWKIELFFKCIKQNLKIKSFVGTSKNAVMTQIWIAMCAYLLLAWIKFSSQIDRSLQQMIRLLQLNLFERRELLPLLRGDPPEPIDNNIHPQLCLM